MKVAVIGLGRVGLPLALSFADRGLDVIGVERVPATLEAIEAGRMPFHETGTQEVLDRVGESGRLRAAGGGGGGPECRSTRPAPRRCSTAWASRGACASPRTWPRPRMPTT